MSLGLLGGLALGPVAQPVLAQSPISAIEWLDRRAGVAARPEGQQQLAAQPLPTGPGAARRLPADEPPVASRIVTPEVTTLPLDAPHAGAVGLLPRDVTGLPATLWRDSLTRPLIRKIEALDVARLPAMQSLFYTLLLAEADPPQDAGLTMSFLLARVAALTDLGAVEPALALVDRAGPETTRDLFASYFDLSLLAGEEDGACERMRAEPSLAPSDAALIFCRARNGDWQTAALTFQNSTALGLIAPAEATLMELFLDPELAEETPPLAPPSRMTPLAFRLSEAVGTPVPSTGLPRAYAMADLRGISGWRTEIEAAERLTRSGAVSENRLLGIYTAREPAASGGIWDRVEAIQTLDAAITSSDAARISRALPPAWEALKTIELEVPFARLWGNELAQYQMDGRAGRDAMEMALLSADYETLAKQMQPQTARDRFLVALAQGEPASVPAPGPLAESIARGFDPAAEVPASIRLDLARGLLGEALLSAIRLYAQAAEGETKDIVPALATLRAAGMQDAARRAALQLMLLERRS
ncbi:hypothetical protein ACRARG_20730 [Pseudooceanicola sp. C21-150M6]|uniref:hypothetical protein n=1 Tax=Pseudooceanicola sp. C21-150M6 TaxID=3434355 RepID=UPI003D7F6BAB